MNQPLAAFEAPTHRGSLGKSLSRLQVNTPLVDIRAAKKAESGRFVIIRLQELLGAGV